MAMSQPGVRVSGYRQANAPAVHPVELYQEMPSEPSPRRTSTIVAIDNQARESVPSYPPTWLEWRANLNTGLLGILVVLMLLVLVVVSNRPAALTPSAPVTISVKIMAREPLRAQQGLPAPTLPRLAGTHNSQPQEAAVLRLENLIQGSRKGNLKTET